jgi:hypothetical protein
MTPLEEISLIESERRISNLEFELRNERAGHISACRTVAAMHEAALGEVTGPKRGVVEDVADVRLRAEKAEAKVIALRFALCRLWCATGPKEFEGLVEPLLEDVP